MTNLPDLTSPTDLSAFGKPNVVLVPRLVTSVAKLPAVTHVMEQLRPELWIGCGGVEMRLVFADDVTCDRCFEWLKACIIENHKTKN
jgi:hypothetical protein